MDQVFHQMRSQNENQNMANALLILLKKIKCLKSQVAEKQLPFHQNLEEMTNAKSKNWLSISLLNIDSTILENVYMYHSFHNLKTSNQASSCIHQNQINGLINAFIFTKIFKTLDNNSKDGMVAFYIDFSKFFDKEPHFEMLR